MGDENIRVNGWSFRVVNGTILNGVRVLLAMGGTRKGISREDWATTEVAAVLVELIDCWLKNVTYWFVTTLAREIDPLRHCHSQCTQACSLSRGQSMPGFCHWPHQVWSNWSSFILYFIAVGTTSPCWPHINNSYQRSHDQNRTLLLRLLVHICCHWTNPADIFYCRCQK